MYHPPADFNAAVRKKQRSENLWLNLLVNMMLAINLFKQCLVIISMLFPFVFAGSTSAGTTDDELNADLIKASFSGNLPEVKRLLDKGANVNASRENGMTALIGASMEGQQEIVELLLAKGAEVDAKVYFFGRNAGATAYDLASQKDHQEIVKLLVRAGAFHEEKVEARPEAKSVPPDTHQSSRRR
jgi:ankyrin repeat protein